MSGEEGGRRRFFVNEGERAGGREEARGLAAGVSFGLQYAGQQLFAWCLRAGMDVGGVGGIVTCYMLHVTLSVRTIREGGEKIGQRIVYINNILFIYTIL